MPRESCKLAQCQQAGESKLKYNVKPCATCEYVDITVLCLNEDYTIIRTHVIEDIGMEGHEVRTGSYKHCTTNVDYPAQEACGAEGTGELPSAPACT
jgi:hypothetical protein